MGYGSKHRSALAVLVTIGTTAIWAPPVGAVGESLSGTITNTAGDPLEGVSVALGPYSTLSAPDGSYGFPSVDGSYQLMFTKTGFRGEVYDEMTISAVGGPTMGTPVTVSTGTQLVIDESLMQLPRLTGRVVNGEGNPVAASVFSELTPFGASGNTVANASGYFTVELPQAGTHRLRSFSPGYLTTYAPSTTNPNAAASWSVAYDQLIDVGQVTLLSGGSISGTVTSSTGIISGATVSATPLPFMMGAGAAPVTTDVSGNYTISGLVQGTYQVTFNAPGFIAENFDNQPQYGAPNFTLVTVVEGQTTSHIDAELAANATVTGHVIDAAGNPVAGAAVQGWQQGPQTYGPSHSTTSDLAGAYTLSGFAAGPYLVTAGKAGLAQGFFTGSSSPSSADIVSLAAGSSTTINFTLQALGSVSGQVLQPNGQPLIGSSVSANVILTPGISWMPQSFATYGTSTSTDASGNYTLSNLAPTTYRVAASPTQQNDPLAFEYYLNQRTEAAANPVAILPGLATTGIDFQLEVGGSISGRVIGSDGSPVAGTYVSAMGPNGEYGGGTPTDMNGQYELRGLPPGSFTVAAQPIEDYPQTYHPSTTNQLEATLITVALGQTRTGIDIQMQAAARIEATVLDPSGAPVPLTGGVYSVWGVGFCIDPGVPVASFSQCSGGPLGGASTITKPGDGQLIGTGITSGTYNVAGFAAFPIAISDAVTLTLTAGDVASCTFQINGPAACTVAHGNPAPDTDGVPGDVEDGAPGGDGNGDTIPDSAQSNVTSLPSPVNGGGYVTVAAPNGLTLTSVTVVDPSVILATPPPGATVASGVIAYTIGGVAQGATVAVDIYLSTPTTADGYAKVQDGLWVPLPASAFTRVSSTHFILRLTDGGTGDEDGLANGVIVDPGAPIQLDSTAPTIACPAAPTFVLETTGATLTAEVADGGSGVDASTMTVAVGTTTLGSRTVNVTASDRAGNTRTVPCSYTVGIRIVRFTAEDDHEHHRWFDRNRDRDGRHDADAGESIELRWRTVDAQGDPVNFPTTISLVTAATTCGSNPTVTGSATAAQLTGTGVRYDGNGYWTAKWRTDRGWRGCRQLTLTAIGDSVVAKFKFSKR